MDKISSGIPERKPITVREINQHLHTTGKKAKNSFRNYGGLFIGILICVLVVVVMTTDISVDAAMYAADVGINFALMLFCSYAMYVSCSDSGIKAARLDVDYIACVERFNELKSKAIIRPYQGRALEFCKHYTDEELIHVRESALIDVGISYDEYKAKYLGKDKKQILEMRDLSKTQTKVIISCNETKPIHLKPEMFMRMGRGSGRRMPFGIKPENEMIRNFIFKFLTTAGISVMMAVTVTQSATVFSLETLASIALKLILVLFNGFGGYRYGYDHIATTTVNYVNDQTDMIRQLINYCDSTTGEAEASLPTNEAEEKEEKEEKKPVA